MLSIKPCYKSSSQARNFWRKRGSAYLCTVFFIVLDLRLTKGKMAVCEDGLFYWLAAATGHVLVAAASSFIYVPVWMQFTC